MRFVNAKFIEKTSGRGLWRSFFPPYFNRLAWAIFALGRCVDLIVLQAVLYFFLVRFHTDEKQFLDQFFGNSRNVKPMIQFWPVHPPSSHSFGINYDVGSKKITPKNDPASFFTLDNLISFVPKHLIWAKIRLKSPRPYSSEYYDVLFPSHFLLSSRQNLCTRRSYSFRGYYFRLVAPLPAKNSSFCGNPVFVTRFSSSPPIQRGRNHHIRP